MYIDPKVFSMKNHRSLFKKKHSVRIRKHIKKIIDPNFIHGYKILCAITTEYTLSNIHDTQCILLLFGELPFVNILTARKPFG